MTREERCKLGIEKGILYNPETGKVTSKFGREYYKKHKGYIRIQMITNKKTYYIFAHQFAWYWINKECIESIDHINGIRDDNRICNLRSVTNQENHMNRTKAKGYTFNKVSNKWHSTICINYKKIYLGCFNTEEEARAAYLKAKEKYHII